MLIIGYPKCSTCKKAEEFLKSKNLKYTYRNIKENNPSYDEIKDLYEKSGLDIKRFFNTTGLIYRELNLKDKLTDMSLEEKLQILATDGMLIKRPILISDDKILVGFKVEEWEIL